MQALRLTFARRSFSLMKSAAKMSSIWYAGTGCPRAESGLSLMRCTERRPSPCTIAAWSEAYSCKRATAAYHVVFLASGVGSLLLGVVVVRRERKDGRFLETKRLGLLNRRSRSFSEWSGVLRNSISMRSQGSTFAAPTAGCPSLRRCWQGRSYSCARPSLASPSRQSGSCSTAGCADLGGYGRRRERYG